MSTIEASYRALLRARNEIDAAINALEHNHPALVTGAEEGGQIEPPPDDEGGPRGNKG